MADKPKDLKPAMEHGEVKVIKNERPPGQDVDPGKTPGSAEAGTPADEPRQTPPTAEAEGGATVPSPGERS